MPDSVFGVQIKGDVAVLATGFKKPEISFFQDELFPEGYEVRKLVVCVQQFADSPPSLPASEFVSAELLDGRLVGSTDQLGVSERYWDCVCCVHHSVCPLTNLVFVRIQWAFVSQTKFGLHSRWPLTPSPLISHIGICKRLSPHASPDPFSN